MRRRVYRNSCRDGQSPHLPSEGFVAPMGGVPAPSMGSTVDNRFTRDADTVLRGTGERIAWQGKPWLLYLLGPAFKWGMELDQRSRLAVHFRVRKS